MNTEDAKVGEYLRKFTFLERAEIEQLEAAHARAPGAREAQKKLAVEVTRLVHSEAALEGALKASAILFGAKIEGVDAATLADVFSEIPRTHLEAARLSTGVALVELLVQAGLETSKGNARKALEAGGIYVNNERADPAVPTRLLTSADLLFERYLLLRKGKKSYAGIELVAG